MTNNAMPGPVENRDSQAAARLREARAIVYDIGTTFDSMVTLAEVHGPRRVRIIVAKPGSMMDFSGGDFNARVRVIPNGRDLPTNTEQSEE